MLCLLLTYENEIPNEIQESFLFDDERQKNGLIYSYPLGIIFIQYIADNTKNTKGLNRNHNY